MKVIFCSFIVVVLLVIAESGPVEKDYEGQAVRADRHRRLTCDLLSIELPRFVVKDAACIAHCLGMLKGYTGGSCKNGVCHCKR